MRMRRIVVLSLLFVCVLLCSVHAQSRMPDTIERDPDGILSVTVWDIDLHPKPTLSEAQLLNMLYERARIRISSMLYGYAFDYTLQNKARNIKEVFQIELVDEIAAGDPNLQLADRWQEGQKWYGRFVYYPNRLQSKRLHAWQHTISNTGGGMGAVKVGAVEDEQRAALNNAFKEGITRYLRAVYRNKPHRATGTALIHRDRRVYIQSGEYRAYLQMRIRLDEVREFQFF